MSEITFVLADEASAAERVVAALEAVLGGPENGVRRRPPQELPDVAREEELPVFERLGDVRLAALQHDGEIVHVLMQKGDLDGALALQEQRLQANRQLGDLDGIAATQWDIARLRSHGSRSKRRSRGWPRPGTFSRSSVGPKASPSSVRCLARFCSRGCGAGGTGAHPQRPSLPQARTRRRGGSGRTIALVSSGVPACALPAITPSSTQRFVAWHKRACAGPADHHGVPNAERDLAAQHIARLIAPPMKMHCGVRARGAVSSNVMMLSLVCAFRSFSAAKRSGAIVSTGS